MMSLGIELWRGRNRLKGEIEEAMMEGIQDNQLTAGVFWQRCDSVDR